ncbi:Disease resistance family protein [Dorcoceras hygrometricum]|uniref:Disease resistance family protein n=1 Tax=Dorcoceras hygrometricum TaxID=472368 RepID=A0A2Z7CLC9_9LAMI|nr:Disease resistance family protein [Dorcoceras hygrometricum]
MMRPQSRELKRMFTVRGDSAHEIFIGVLVHSNERIGKMIVDRIRSNQGSATYIGEIVGVRRIVARQTPEKFLFSEVPWRLWTLNLNESTMLVRSGASPGLRSEVSFV